MPMWYLGLLVPIGPMAVWMALWAQEKWRNRNAKIRRVLHNQWVNWEARKRCCQEGCQYIYKGDVDA